jgi:hypothetical protein
MKLKDVPRSSTLFIQSLTKTHDHDPISNNIHRMSPQTRHGQSYDMDSWNTLFHILLLCSYILNVENPNSGSKWELELATQHTHTQKNPPPRRRLVQGFQITYNNIHKYCYKYCLTTKLSTWLWSWPGCPSPTDSEVKRKVSPVPRFASVNPLEAEEETPFPFPFPWNPFVVLLSELGILNLYSPVL